MEDAFEPIVNCHDHEDEMVFMPSLLDGCLRLENKQLICENTFEKSELKNLSEINASDADIEALPANFTSNLQNLKILNLKGNKLSQLPEQINRLTALKQLVASDNKLCLVNEDIGSISNLNFLDVSNNVLTQIPDSIVSLLNLKHLKLSNNSISELPEEIGALVNLEILDVSKNELSTVPETINNLHILTQLNMSHNKLTKLPDCFDSYRLCVLLLSNNCFVNVPNCILYNLPCISILDLSHNSIKFFDHAPKCVTKLGKFDISNNNLCDIPSWLFREKPRFLKQLNISCNKNMIGTSKISSYARSGDPAGVTGNLRHLNASNCCFSSSSLAFLHGLKGLESLDISNTVSTDRMMGRYGSNVIIHFPSATLSTCTNLKYINMSFVAMSVMAEDVGNLSANLEVLDISYNELILLPDTFCKLVSLSKLNLSHNQLERLPPSFGMLATLEELRLNGNKIQALPDSIRKLRKLKSLDLYDNTLGTFPLVLFSLPVLEALDLELNDFKMSDFDQVNGEFSLSYESLKTNMRTRLSLLDQQIRQDGHRFECPGDEIDYEEDVSEDDKTTDESEEELGETEESGVHEQQIEERKEENWDDCSDTDDFFPQVPQLQRRECRNKENAYGPALLVYDPMKVDNFCPGDYHSEKVMRARKVCENENVVEGQFDDAE